MEHGSRRMERIETDLFLDDPFGFVAIPACSRQAFYPCAIAVQSWMMYSS